MSVPETSPDRPHYSGPPAVPLPPRAPGRRKPALRRQPPVILRHQPQPVDTHVARMLGGVTWFTAIVRRWHDGDEARCRLCERCDASNGVCLKMVNRFVSYDDAPLYNSLGHTMVPQEGGPQCST